MGLCLKSLQRGLGFQAADGGQVWKMKQAENDYNLDPHLEVLRSVISGCAVKSLQLCPTLRDPKDGSPPGSAIPGIFQARVWSGLPLYLLIMSKSIISNPNL